MSHIKLIRDCNGTSSENIWKKEDNVIASSSTVKTRLIDAGLNGRISRRKPLLPKEHRDWTEDIWSKVVWSDESKFNLFHSDGQMYI